MRWRMEDEGEGEDEGVLAFGRVLRAVEDGS